MAKLIPLKVGLLHYLNSFPYSLYFQRCISSYSLVYGVPATINQLLREKKLDIGLISTYEFINGNYSLLEGYGIAASQEILSVNVYTQVPFEELHGRCIGLSHESSTSVALLKVLCREFWKISPRFELIDPSRALNHYSAYLLIGDAALKHNPSPKFTTVDLATVWHTMTSLPFVFAVFGSQNILSEETKRDFLTFLNQALQWSEVHREEMIDIAHQQSTLPVPLLRTYYSLCKYRLSDLEMNGLDTFKRLCHV